MPNNKCCNFISIIKNIIIILGITMFSCLCYATTTYPLQVQEMNGITTIKNKPQRIVALEFGLLDELKLLGVTPVGYSQSDPSEGNNPDFLQGYIKNSTSVGTRDEPNLEAIAKLKPDMILGDYSFLANVNPQLNMIAPTILFNGVFGDPKEQVKNLKILAKITGTEDKVPGILKSYADIKNKAVTLAKKGSKKTVLIGFITPTGIFKALTANAIATPILAELNRDNVIKKTEPTQVVDLTTESILNYNPDQIIVLLTDGNMAPYAKLTSDPLWGDVKANKNRQIYFMDRNSWARSHGIEAQEIMYQKAISTGFLTAKVQ